jgi:hypothetical protein
MNNYSKFKEDDKVKSRDLGDELKISESDIRTIDDWFTTYLDRHSQAIGKDNMSANSKSYTVRCLNV